MPATLKVEVRGLSDYHTKVDDRAKAIPIIVFAHEGWKNCARANFQTLGDAVGDLRCTLPLVSVDLDEPDNVVLRSVVFRRAERLPSAYLETKEKYGGLVFDLHNPNRLEAALATVMRAVPIADGSLIGHPPALRRDFTRDEEYIRGLQDYTLKVTVRSQDSPVIVFLHDSWAGRAKASGSLSGAPCR